VGVNRKDKWLASGLVAGVLAVLALFAVPTGPVVAAPVDAAPAAQVAATHTAGGPGSRSTFRRPPRTAAVITQNDAAPPALATLIGFAAVALVLLGVIRPVAGRRQGHEALRLPSARAPPLPAV
jgi:hypothetical protein